VINPSFLATMPRMSVFKLVLGGFLAVLGSVALKPTSFMDNSAAIAHPLLRRAVSRHGKEQRGLSYPRFRRHPRRGDRVLGFKLLGTDIPERLV
jgi:hypothetical protein